MTLQDIYDQIAYGELSDFFQGGGTIDDGNSGIPADFYSKYLPFIKSGLTDLHTRFALREHFFNVVLAPPKIVYSLDYIYATSNTRSIEPVKWIDDSAYPYENNLLKVARIEGVLGDQPYEITLDAVDDPASIRRPAYNMLLIPDDPELAPWLEETTALKVFYQADHPAINTPRANAAPRVTQIYLPPSLLEPLVLYVASRKMNPRGMTPGAMHEGNNYYQRYEAACAMQADKGISIPSGSQNTRAEIMGWV